MPYLASCGVSMMELFGTSHRPDWRRGRTWSPSVAYYLVVKIEVVISSKLMMVFRSDASLYSSLSVTLGEHDVMLAHAAHIAELQLRQAGAITAKAFLMQNLDEARGRRHLCIPCIPGSTQIIPLYLAGVLTDRLLIVNVKRSQIGFSDLLHLLGVKRSFFSIGIAFPLLGYSISILTEEFAQIDPAHIDFPCAGSRSRRYQRYGRP